jgi:hypothetical protein
MGSNLMETCTVSVASLTTWYRTVELSSGETHNETATCRLNRESRKRVAVCSGLFGEFSRDFDANRSRFLAVRNLNGFCGLGAVVEFNSDRQAAELRFILEIRTTERGYA